MNETKQYTTEVQCENCLSKFNTTFQDPAKPFSGTCPDCGTHHPELYV